MIINIFGDGNHQHEITTFIRPFCMKKMTIVFVSAFHFPFAISFCPLPCLPLACQHASFSSTSFTKAQTSLTAKPCYLYIILTTVFYWCFLVKKRFPSSNHSEKMRTFMIWTPNFPNSSYQILPWQPSW
jgi:hypothetical protein